MLDGEKINLSTRYIARSHHARKLGKKAYRKRRKLSAAANSISAGNPGLPLLRGVLSQRVFLQASTRTSLYRCRTEGLNRPAARE